MRIAICDDDPVIRNEIQKNITEYSNKHALVIPEIHLFSSGEDLIADAGIFDIAFLDVEMPGISGIHAGRELAKRNRKILNFVITSYEDYLDEAMNFHAFRFLTKPVDKQRFFRNYKSALATYHSTVEKIAIETKDSIFTIYTSDIIMVESRFKKTLIMTSDSTFQTIQRMDYWAQALCKLNFFQTHRSFIVNMEHVDNFNHNTINLYNGQYSAYLTVRKYTAFKKAFLMYLECTRS